MLVSRLSRLSLHSSCYKMCCIDVMEAKFDCISDKSTNTNSNMCTNSLIKTDAELPSL